MTASYRSISSGTTSGADETILVPRPAGMAPTDILWAIQAALFDDFDDIEDPAGWMPVGDQIIDDSLGLYARLYRRTGPGGGTGPYAFPHAGPNAGAVVIVTADGASTTVPMRVAVGPWYEVADQAPTPNVAPAAASHLEIRIGVAFAPDTLSWSAPSGYVTRRVTTAGEALTVLVATREISSSAPSGPKSFTASESQVFGSHGITISIPSAVTVPDVPPVPVDAPGAGDALYSYRFSRLFGGRLGDLDLHGVSFEKRISRRGQINVGNFSATYPIANENEGDLVAKIIPRRPSDLLRGPGVTVVDIWRAGDDHWGRYWIIGAKISKKRRTRPVLTLSGVDMIAYLSYVELEEALGPFEDEDRVEIVRQLIDHLQSQEHADIGLLVQGGLSESTLTRTYEAHKGKYGQHLADATAGTDGIELMVNTELGAEGVELHLVWGQPLGDADAPHMFTDSPGGGEILDVDIDMTPLTRGTRWRARGDSIDTDASTTSEPLLSAAYSSPHLATGVWPRIDRTVDRPGVTSLAQLNAVAAELAATSGGAPHVMSVAVLLGEQPTIHPNKLGDTARIVITDEWFRRVNSGAGLDERRRILGMKVTPVGRENGRDEAELFIDDQEVE